MEPTAYPLTWPHNIPRTKNKTASKFKTGLPGALKNVRSSLHLFAADSGRKVENITISSNVTLGEDRPSDTGVAVWFTWDGMSVCIAVDRYPKVEDNVQAIYHIIDGRRTELRHGGLHIVRATFTGLLALPAPTKKNWREVLGLEGSNGVPSADAIEQAYKELARKAHPDAGGSAEAMAELNVARDEALKELRA
ncbi:heat shock protein DnaJ domain protein [Rhizobium sp. CF080]|uniref:J domain-containing protein n=1 Tax=Rhizobium sp. (strain CF080) TaxID=1144310 RepID=UPI000271D60B|nr:J domain-containing protein [Rhizobium sp. CF080]EUB97229.1 heat shock protein DnaJ domain protein [Rhizobium sp. CF080]